MPHYLIPIDWYKNFVAHVRYGRCLERLKLDPRELDKLKDKDGEFRANLRPGKDVQVLQAAVVFSQQSYNQPVSSAIFV